MTTTVRLLGVASVAVAFAAADTYVVVLALPDMMASVGIPIDQLQRAAPIVSGCPLSPTRIARHAGAGCRHLAGPPGLK